MDAATRYYLHFLLDGFLGAEFGNSRREAVLCAISDLETFGNGGSACLRELSRWSEEVKKKNKTEKSIDVEKYIDSQLQEHESCVVVSGYYNKTYRTGHQVVLKVTSSSVVAYNSGEGVYLYHQRMEDGTYDVTRTSRFERKRFDGYSKKLESELASIDILYQQVLGEATPPRPSEESPVKFENKESPYLSFRVNNQSLFARRQLSGSCTFYSLYYYILHQLFLEDPKCNLLNFVKHVKDRAVAHVQASPLFWNANDEDSKTTVMLLRATSQVQDFVDNTTTPAPEEKDPEVKVSRSPEIFRQLSGDVLRSESFFNSLREVENWGAIDPNWVVKVLKKWFEEGLPVPENVGLLRKIVLESKKVPALGRALMVSLLATFLELPEKRPHGVVRRLSADVQLEDKLVLKTGAVVNFTEDLERRAEFGHFTDEIFVKAVKENFDKDVSKNPDFILLCSKLEGLTLYSYDVGGHIFRTDDTVYSHKYHVAEALVCLYQGKVRKAKNLLESVLLLSILPDEFTYYYKPPSKVKVVSYVKEESFPSFPLCQLKSVLPETSLPLLLERSKKELGPREQVVVHLALVSAGYDILEPLDREVVEASALGEVYHRVLADPKGRDYSDLFEGKVLSHPRFLSKNYEENPRGTWTLKRPDHVAPRVLYKKADSQGFWYEDDHNYKYCFDDRDRVVFLNEETSDSYTIYFQVNSRLSGDTYTVANKTYTRNTNPPPLFLWLYPRSCCSLFEKGSERFLLLLTPLHKNISTAYFHPKHEYKYLNKYPELIPLSKHFVPLFTSTTQKKKFQNNMQLSGAFLGLSFLCLLPELVDRFTLLERYPKAVFGPINLTPGKSFHHSMLYQGTYEPFTYPFLVWTEEVTTPEESLFRCVKNLMEASTNFDEERWETQKRAIRSITQEKDKGQCSLRQLTMGSGKSSVIIPFIAVHHVLTKRKSAVVVVPDHLSATTYNTFNLKFYVFYPKLVHLEPPYLEDLRGLLRDVLERNGVHESDESFWRTISGQAVLNMLFESRVHLTQVYVASCTEWKNCILEHQKDETSTIFHKLAFKESLLIVDEFDTLYDPSTSETNFTDLSRSSTLPELEQATKYAWNCLRGSGDTPPDTATKKAVDDAIACFRELVENVDFGYAQDESKLTAVPYTSSRTPDPVSTFSSPYLTLVLTLHLLLKNGFQRRHVSYLSDSLWRSDPILRNLGVEEDLQEALQRADHKHCIGRLNEKGQEFRVRYLTLGPLRQILVANTRRNISSMEAFSSKFTNLKVAFSGTVSVVLPDWTVADVAKTEQEKKTWDQFKDYVCHFKKKSNPPQDFQWADLPDVTEVVCDPLYENLKSRVVPDEATETGTQYVWEPEATAETALDLVVKDGFSVLVDGGALFKEWDLERVLSGIFQRSSGRKVVFLNNEKGIPFLQDSEGNRTVFSDPDEPSLLYYFDHKNSRGTDVRQRKSLKGLVTVDPAVSTLTSVLQACARLREIEKKELVLLVRDRKQEGGKLTDYFWSLEKRSLARTEKSRKLQNVRLLCRRSFGDYVVTGSLREELLGFGGVDKAADKLIASLNSVGSFTDSSTQREVKKEVKKEVQVPDWGECFQTLRNHSVDVLSEDKGRFAQLISRLGCRVSPFYHCRRGSRLLVPLTVDQSYIVVFLDEVACYRDVGIPIPVDQWDSLPAVVLLLMDYPLTHKKLEELKSALRDIDVPQLENCLRLLGRSLPVQGGGGRAPNSLIYRAHLLKVKRKILYTPAGSQFLG